MTDGGGTIAAILMICTWPWPSIPMAAQRAQVSQICATRPGLQGKHAEGADGHFKSCRLVPLWQSAREGGTHRKCLGNRRSLSLSSSANCSAFTLTPGPGLQGKNEETWFPKGARQVQTDFWLELRLQPTAAHQRHLDTSAADTRKRSESFWRHGLA